MLGVDELVAGGLAQVFNVVDEEDVGGGVVGQEDDLGAALGEFVGDSGADA